MESIAAIDIGSTKAATVLVDVDARLNTRVVAVGTSDCRGLKRGTVVDIEETAQAVVSSVRRGEQMANRKIGHVILSVSGDHISGQNSQGIVPIVPPARAITREDVNRVINHSKQIVLAPDRELIHAIPRSFRVDGQDGVSRPVGMSGDRLEVSTHLVTGQATHLQNLERCVNRAQIEVDHVVLSSLACGLATLSRDEMEAGIAVVDIGGGTTDVAVYTDGNIAYTGVVPIAGAHITSDVSKLLKTTPEEAERLKLASGSCSPENEDKDAVVAVRQSGAEGERPFPRRVLAEIIEARMREILIMVRGLAESSRHHRVLAAGYVLTGGGSRLSGLLPLAQRIMGDAPVRLGTPCDLGGLSDMASGPEYSTVVGLVKYGLKMMEEETVQAEAGDWRRLFRGITSIFGPKTKT
ncbi:MAG: cell division protein FtsA [Armatimonadetes bacterium]|nr:cell division protein FtsA [Armatimonadota bacterium]